ncbi:MAG: HAD-IB family hydrolase [Nitrospirae bacterium]|nr:HAD-IB family hydrolase [Nitrospirota bacterium]MDA1303576.1 HAD-IB family hydrolase [Nitrospirota bacterium]
MSDSIKPPYSQSSPEGTIGAFFDVDNTLIPGQSIEIRFVRYLWKNDFLSKRVLIDSGLYLLFNLLEFSLRPLRERKIYLTDKRPEGIEPLAKWFVRSEICPRLSLKGTTALAQHLQAGHQVALVSGTPEFLIRPLAHFLDVPNVFASRLETNGDGYTGRVLAPYPYGEGKRRLLQTFAESHGVDLTQSYAYGDSPGDIQALESVGHPLVVNPIRGMAKIARKHRWPIALWA